ncbi:RNase A-like domain-containing protein [Streptomyces chitinivorans]|uniref:RNase A-like domain-containing protein n=1 Tax=Streptomyces chitinivorans TaxID=1257027 RepID=A0ABW7HXH3_9ACTN|nr:RNase A-like domain-containing protein [Streptomyces chitinivorans]MDH2407445.1 hypothetical protein [Streptomyces chitinivorans]
MPSIKWTGTHDDSDSQVAAVLGDIPDFIASVIRPAVEHVLNLGRVHEITPGAKEDELKGIGAAWRAAGGAALKTADGLTRSIDYITDGRNSEWQGAMRSFCQSIWGTTAWGKERHGHNWRTDKSASPSGRRPIVQVLNKTALAVEAACNDVGTAIVETKEKTTRLGKEAAWATAKDLSIDLDFWELTRLTSPLAFTEIVMTFRSHMDSAAVNAAVDAYHAVCRGAADDILKFLPELDEAYLSAPTFRAEEARAQAFGARSLNEFKKEHSYTVPNGAKENHFYAIDLAGQEDLHGSHVIDKHVGKTDEQLAQRLRDQQLIRNGAVRPEAASSFKDLQSAQYFTQEAMDDITNAQKIENWVANQEGRPVENPRSTLTIKHTFNESTGHTVTRDEYDANGINAPAADTHSVQVVLRCKRGIDPPFVVLTSMPTTP